MAKNAYSGTVLTTCLLLVVHADAMNPEKFHSFGADNSKEMPTRQIKSSSSLSDKGTPFWHKSKIQSFAHLEANEEVWPVDIAIINLANSVIEKNWEASTLVPFMTVPTRSAGIALDYRIGEQEVYYRFLDDETIFVTHRINKKSQKTIHHAGLSGIPLVSDLIS